MSLLFAYLESRKKRLLVCLSFAGIYVVTFLLYHLPVLAAIYPASICGLFGFLLLLLDFREERKKHKLLEAGKSVPLLFLPPAAEYICEKDYRELVELLQQEAFRISGEWKQKYDSMMEYYTVWAHQIKTPIASLRLALQKEDSAESRRLLYELRRIEGYVEMVLVFLRLDSDSTDYVFREQALDPMLRQTIRRFAPDFIAKKLQFTYEPVGARAVTDEKWLCFVLEQLLSNALKYTRQGSIRIYSPKEKQLCIEDTGIGIAPEDLPRIFERGFTGGNGRADKQASGLGLYLCRQICNRLHIGLSAESEVNVGTKIVLDFSQYEGRKE